MDGLIDKTMRPASIKVAQALRNHRIHPDFITTCGFICNFIAAICFAYGQAEYSILASLFILLAIFLDCLDGDLARIRNLPTQSGAFLEQIAHWICQALLIIGIVIGYDGRIDLLIDPILMLGLALVSDQMFHLIFFIINGGMRTDKSYGSLHIIVRKILPLMPINSNVFWITGMLTIPQYGLIVYTVFSASMFLIIASIFYMSERRFDQEETD